MLFRSHRSTYSVCWDIPGRCFWLAMPPQPMKPIFNLAMGIILLLLYAAYSPQTGNTRHIDYKPIVIHMGKKGKRYLELFIKIFCSRPGLIVTVNYISIACPSRAYALPVSRSRRTRRRYAPPQRVMCILHHPNDFQSHLRIPLYRENDFLSFTNEKSFINHRVAVAVKQGCDRRTANAFCHNVIITSELKGRK